MNLLCVYYWVVELYCSATVLSYSWSGLTGVSAVLLVFMTASQSCCISNQVQTISKTLRYSETYDAYNH